MTSRYLFPVWAALVLAFGLGAGSRSEAASLSLVPSELQVIEGSTFFLDLVLDARDAPGAHPDSTAAKSSSTSMQLSPGTAA